MARLKPHDTPSDEAPSATVNEAALKAQARSQANATALQSLSNHFGAERWAKLLQRAERSGLTAAQITDLAGRMVSTRQVQYPQNERAALWGAALGFVCALGLSPSEAEVKAFESALAATVV